MVISYQTILGMYLQIIFYIVLNSTSNNVKTNQTRNKETTSPRINSGFYWNFYNQVKLE